MPWMFRLPFIHSAPLPAQREVQRKKYCLAQNSDQFNSNQLNSFWNQDFFRPINFPAYATH